MICCNRISKQFAQPTIGKYWTFYVFDSGPITLKIGRRYFRLHAWWLSYLNSAWKIDPFQKKDQVDPRSSFEVMAKNVFLSFLPIVSLIETSCVWVSEVVETTSLSTLHITVLTVLLSKPNERLKRYHSLRVDLLLHKWKCQQLSESAVPLVLSTITIAITMET